LSFFFEVLVKKVDSEEGMPTQNLQRSALTLAVVSSFVTPVMGSAVNLALPAVGTYFALDAVTLSWIQTSYLLAIAVCVLPAGRLADIHGRKKTFALGMAVFGLSSLLTASAFSALVLIIARVFQGIGSAMIFATGMAIISAVFPPGQRGRAMGISVAAIYVGLTLGPFLGGFLTQYLTWRSVFAMGVPFSALAFGVAVWGLKAEWVEAKGEKFDLTGSLIYGLALVALIQGVGLLPGMTAMGFIISGLAVLGVFVWWEGRAEFPIFKISLFKSNRVFAFSSVAALINYCATFAVTFLLSLYLQHVKGLNPQSAGLILIAQPIMMALFSPLAGRLSDRIQPRIVSSVGMGLNAVGLFCLAFISSGTEIIYIVVCLLINGAGFGIFSSPNMNAIMSSVEKRYYGIAAGAVASMRILGQMASMGIAASVIAVYVGRVRIAPENYPALVDSIVVAFIIFGCLCLVGILASLSRGELANNHDGM
jgi:EmrB/QacA subfamily drug resistance transporter